MFSRKHSGYISEIKKISREAKASSSPDRCIVSPSPELRDQIKKDLEESRKTIRGIVGNMLKVRRATPPGFNDGLIYPGDLFPIGTPVDRVRNAAADRTPLSGIIRVVVVLVDFADESMNATQQHFEELFFDTTGAMPNGSVCEYFQDVSNSIIDIQGEVVGPYTLPQTLVQYANGASGIGSSLPNARTMARDAAEAANPDVNYAPYDNDSDGYVDAFIVIHAGQGAESTGNSDHIWSHKWVLSGGDYNADGTKIYAYLTVPEDANIGVCCHELGHLLFGWPDLYDTDYSSEGVGNWCLMGGGSWNRGGEIPAHPGAWCKADQGWVTVQNQTSNTNVNISDVKNSHIVHRLWKNGNSGSEYFLVENRQRTGFDAALPGEGLLIWHIDDSISSNTNENHYKVALEQADSNKNLENGDNRGDSGDSFPGGSNNTTFDSTSDPNSNSYAGVDTCVSVGKIGPTGPIMTADLRVKCIDKYYKEGKEFWKDVKDRIKERKEFFKEHKDWIKEKEIIREKPEIEGKDIVDKRLEKPDIDKRVGYDKGFADKPQDKYTDKPAEGGPEAPGVPSGESMSNLRNRLAYLEAWIASIEPFIDESLRPDLRQSALTSEDDVQKIGSQMQKSAVDSKRSYDTKPSDG